MREAKTEGGRGGSRGGGRGAGRGRGGGSGFNRDSNNEATFGSNNGFSGGYRPSEEVDTGKPSEKRGYGGPRGGFRGGRRGGLSNGEAGEGERPRRLYERRSGTGRGLVFVEITVLSFHIAYACSYCKNNQFLCSFKRNEFKRDGAGRGNWGTPADEIAP